MQITKNNYQRQIGTGDTFKIEFDPLPATTDNHFVSSLRAVEELYSIKQGKVHLLYSGGIDSEYALSLFLYLKMDVIPVIVQLTPGYNTHDTDYAFKFCKSKKLNPIVIDIDFDNFVKSGKMLDLAKEIKSSVYHRPAIAHAVEQLDGTVFLGDNEPHIVLHNGRWYFEIHENEYAVTNHFLKKGIYGTTHFGCWTPQMTVSFLSDNRMQDLANNKVPGKLGSESSKHFVYNRNSNFNLEVRQKLTGYEIIERRDIFKHDSFRELTEFGKTCSGVYSIDYFEFMKQCAQ